MTNVFLVSQQDTGSTEAPVYHNNNTVTLTWSMRWKQRETNCN